MVTVDLALNVSAANGNTRMASDVVNPTSLDIDDWSVLPFVVPSDQDSIRKTDTPAMNALTDFPTYEKHYLISGQKLSIGVNAFLCYVVQVIILRLIMVVLLPQVQVLLPSLH